MEYLMAIGILLILALSLPRPTESKPISTIEIKPKSPEDYFDEAWISGTRSYDGLINYVRDKTGTGTSKSRVKTWKSDRGYL